MNEKLLEEHSPPQDAQRTPREERRNVVKVADVEFAMPSL
jgi:hypothetical protein